MFPGNSSQMHNWVMKNPEPKSPSRRQLRGGDRLLGVVVALIVVVALAMIVSWVPVNYVIQRPGPTVNVLGNQDDTPVLEFARTSDDGPIPRTATGDDGELRMVTVSTLGGPGTTVRVGDVVRAWLRPGVTVRPYYELYAPQTTADEVEQAGQAQMQSSHSAAAVAAMDYLGVPMETTLTVVGTVPDGGANGILEEGDVVRSLRTPDGVEHPVVSPSTPFTLMEEVPPASPVEVTVERDGEERTFTVITSAAHQDEDEEGLGDTSGPEDEGTGSRMGVYLSADTDMPLEVQIHLERIGGPSAGLIFALGIIDQLTEGGITGGKEIAGTGALDFAGNVLPIGGVVQKMYGAQRDGAPWFLVPADNCAEAVGHEPEGLRVIPVQTLSGAVDAVRAIAAGQADTLPSCPQE